MTVTNCGMPVRRRRRPEACGSEKALVTGHPGSGLAAPEQRIALLGQPAELRAHHPGALHELELARDVGVEADEVEAALAVVAAGTARAPPRAATAPYSRPRRRIRWNRVEAIASSRKLFRPKPSVRTTRPRNPAGRPGRSALRGLARRMWAPSGQRVPSDVGVERELVVADVVGVRAGPRREWAGRRRAISGSPVSARPTIASARARPASGSPFACRRRNCQKP